MAGKSLKWNGEALLKAMDEAQQVGINQTMSACVEHATNNHPFKNRSTFLEGSLDVAQSATRVEGGYQGKWGSLDIEYALAIELGATINHPGGTAYYIDESGKAVFMSNRSALSEGLPRTKPHRIVIKPHPFLRPAGDAQYPGLTDRVRKALERRHTAIYGKDKG
ncbi:hypothetical protein [Novosphingobium sp.]|uniref:hypothetical protein n=1 Tax=Novosphingobium sp. TaxID=1874826 RepID=UPI0027327783|nr:hypothetical protein [Novosphingobium sp.]MDP3908717.1 hypothetical protein [Novosphingobium sp.]